MQGQDTDAQDQPPPFFHIRLATHGWSIQLGQSLPKWAVRATSASPVSDGTADVADPRYGDQGKVDYLQRFRRSGWLARTLEIARSCAGRRAAAHAGFADVNALAQLLRVIFLVLLRNARPLLIAVFRFSRAVGQQRGCQYE